MEASEHKFLPDKGILIIGGSPRKGGNSDVILAALSERLGEMGVPCDTIYLRDHEITPCIGCEACRKDHVCHGVRDDMQRLYPKIIAARGLVLVSPTHHYNVTAWMKAFIDRMYCFYWFGDAVPRPWSSCLAGQGRVGAVVAVCEQADPKDMGFTLEAMKLPLQAFGYEVADAVSIFKIFKKAGVKAVPEVMARLARAADTIGAAYEKCLDKD